MRTNEKDTVLLVCGEGVDAAAITGKLFNAGIDVIGPFHTAGMALAITAHSQPTLALVAGQPVGQRKAAELAAALMTTWGVRSLLLDPLEPTGADVPEWLAHQHQIDRVRDALAMDDL